MSYEAFLARKLVRPLPAGLTDVPPLHPALFPFQREAVTYLLRVGRGAAFLDTGLGKTLCQLEWARVVAEHTGRPVLILAPLAVAAQTVREGARFGVAVQRAQRQGDVTSARIVVTNYERLDDFDPAAFGGVVLDESSILKAFMGATKRALCERFAQTPFRLACTATPAPNDFMEIGNHSAFLGVMPANEMLSRWFINDSMNFGTYRLKGHAERDFWRWVASWAVCVSRPSDLDDSDDGFTLPPLDVRRHVVKADLVTDRGDALFRQPEMSATSLHREKRLTIAARAACIAELVAAEPAEPWLLWCDTDYEADALRAAIPDAVEVRGSEPVERKEAKLLSFVDGAARVLITKPKIAGWGLNFQHCARIGFVGLSFSYEAYYQAIRRCWRFGQRRPVMVHIVMADTEHGIWSVIQRKIDQHEQMKAAMCRENFKRLAVAHGIKHHYHPTRTASLPAWMVPA